MKIFISAGHPMYKGASAILDETVVDRAVVKELEAILKTMGHTVKVLNSEATNDYVEEVQVANSSSYDWYIDIHANCFSSESANGVETLVYTDNKPQAHAISKNIADLGFYNRGVKTRTDLYILKNTNAKALLVECFFISSPKDCALYGKVGAKAIAKAIAEGLTSQSYNGSTITETPVVNTPTVTTPQPTQSQYDKAKEYNKARCLEIQQKLNKIGYSLVEDGIYGGKTHSAIGDYQSKNGLTVDYLMGVSSFKKLDSIIASKNTATSKGDDWIRRLQDECNKQGFRDKNGNKLSEDGILGEMTISAMPVIKKGTRGNITKLVQELLVSKGYDTGGVDGIAGGKTESAIRNYQRARNISVDGCFGKDSLRVYGK